MESRIAFENNQNNVYNNGCRLTDFSSTDVVDGDYFTENWRMLSENHGTPVKVVLGESDGLLDRIKKRKLENTAYG